MIERKNKISLPEYNKSSLLNYYYLKNDLKKFKLNEMKNVVKIMLNKKFKPKSLKMYFYSDIKKLINKYT